MVTCVDICLSWGLRFVGGWLFVVYVIVVYWIGVFLLVIVLITLYFIMYVSLFGLYSCVLLLESSFSCVWLWCLFLVWFCVLCCWPCVCCWLIVGLVSCMIITWLIRVLIVWLFIVWLFVPICVVLIVRLFCVVLVGLTTWVGFVLGRYLTCLIVAFFRVVLTAFCVCCVDCFVAVFWCWVWVSGLVWL